MVLRISKGDTTRVISQETHITYEQTVYRSLQICQSSQADPNTESQKIFFKAIEFIDRLLQPEHDHYYLQKMQEIEEEYENIISNNKLRLEKDPEQKHKLDYNKYMEWLGQIMLLMKRRGLTTVAKIQDEL